MSNTPAKTKPAAMATVPRPPIVITAEESMEGVWALCIDQHIWCHVVEAYEDEKVIYKMAEGDRRFGSLQEAVDSLADKVAENPSIW